MSTNGDVKMAFPGPKLSIEQVQKEGCLLWAKIQGYSYWPGIVTVDPMDGLVISESSKTCKVHVHFLGYSNMRGWVALSNVLLYEGKEAFDGLAAKAPKSRSRDFFPTKKYQVSQLSLLRVRLINLRETRQLFGSVSPEIHVFKRNFGIRHILCCYA